MHKFLSSSGASAHHLKPCASVGTQYKALGALLPLVATVILVVAGSGLTGPSMNPAHAFSWNYFLQVLPSLYSMDTNEHAVQPFSASLGKAAAENLKVSRTLQTGRTYDVPLARNMP